MVEESQEGDSNDRQARVDRIADEMGLTLDRWLRDHPPAPPSRTLAEFKGSRMWPEEFDTA